MRSITEEIYSFLDRNYRIKIIDDDVNCAFMYIEVNTNRARYDTELWSNVLHYLNKNHIDVYEKISNRGVYHYVYNPGPDQRSVSHDIITFTIMKWTAQKI